MIGFCQTGTQYRVRRDFFMQTPAKQCRIQWPGELQPQCQMIGITALLLLPQPKPGLSFAGRHTITFAGQQL
ncbi:hypothetical protein C1N58_21050 (plasmid) [Pantoea sp. SGAir0180]